MNGKGEVCLEEEVERRRRSGMSTDEIARDMGVDPAWIESLVSMWEPDEEPSAKSSKPEEAGA